MRRRNDLPELLSPAGGEEALYAAVEGGADAVYLGVTGFNARASAQNFSFPQLEKAVPYCHIRGVKVYVTMNTLLFDREFEAFTETAQTAASLGADGFIVADLGAAKRLSLLCPGVPLHASTQAFCHSLAGAEALFDLGFSRVVLARELSYENISLITRRARAETEVFLHGALCVCHSGQCLFSSMVGGRSGNRGECAQPCRLPYGGKYPLSLKDLSLARHIPRLIESGTSSLKIEGRMKDPFYVYRVPSVYRRLLNENRAAASEAEAFLARVFSREGFTDGYFTGKPFSPMTGVRREADKAESRELRLARDGFSPLPCPVSARAVVEENRPLSLTLSFRGKEGVSCGEAPLKATSSALTREEAESRLMKLGGTFFSLAKEDLHLSLGEGLFVPVSALNGLRRDAAERLTAAFRSGEANPLPPPVLLAASFPPLPQKNDRYRTAVFYRPSVFDETDTSFFDVCFLPAEGFGEAKKKPEGVLFPPVITDGEREDVLTLLRRAKEKGAKYALLSSAAQLKDALDMGFIPIGDFRLNCTNRESLSVYAALGFRRVVASPELPLPAQGGEGLSAVLYGRLPLMLTER
ncbi:MAG: U32 family peptidase, partial [Clostridia bacterium]|nr:U32 family peptidase [Clostridia bacterium]